MASILLNHFLAKPPQGHLCSSFLVAFYPFLAKIFFPPVDCSKKLDRVRQNFAGDVDHHQAGRWGHFYEVRYGFWLSQHGHETIYGKSYYWWARRFRKVGRSDIWVAVRREELDSSLCSPHEVQRNWIYRAITSWSPLNQIDLFPCKHWYHRSCPEVLRLW